jgi:hypothetical protein
MCVFHRVPLILELRLWSASVEGGLWSGLLSLWPHYFALAPASSSFCHLITHHDLVKWSGTTAQSCLQMAASSSCDVHPISDGRPRGQPWRSRGTRRRLYCGRLFRRAAFTFWLRRSRGRLCDAQVIARVRRGYRIRLWSISPQRRLHRPYVFSPSTSRCGFTLGICYQLAQPVPATSTHT